MTVTSTATRAADLDELPVDDAPCVHAFLNAVACGDAASAAIYCHPDVDIEWPDGRRVDGVDALAEFVARGAVRTVVSRATLARLPMIVVWGAMEFVDTEGRRARELVSMLFLVVRGRIVSGRIDARGPDTAAPIAGA